MEIKDNNKTSELLDPFTQEEGIEPKADKVGEVCTSCEG